MRPEPARKASARARRLAKRPPDVQQTGGISPAIGTAHGNEKAAGIQRLFLTVSVDPVTACALEPLAPVATIHARPTPVAIHAALEAAMPPTSAAEAAPHIGQDGEAAFLAVVQGLVERISRVCDPLHRRCRGWHSVGAFAQARHHIIRLLLVLRTI